MIDGIVGAMDFRTGTWQGYFDEDLIATIDLRQVKKSFNTISRNFLKDQRSWIFYPTEVICLVSNDNRTFTPVGNYKFGINTPKDDIEIKKIKFEQPSNLKYRYVKIRAKKLGVLPEWHLGYEHDGRSWMFVDEITIK